MSKFCNYYDVYQETLLRIERIVISSDTMRDWDDDWQELEILVEFENLEELTEVWTEADIDLLFRTTTGEVPPRSDDMKLCEKRFRNFWEGLSADYQGKSDYHEKSLIEYPPLIILECIPNEAADQHPESTEALHTRTTRSVDLEAKFDGKNSYGGTQQVFSTVNQGTVYRWA
jgi:hypothetical protein